MFNRMIAAIWVIFCMCFIWRCAIVGGTFEIFSLKLYHNRWCEFTKRSLEQIKIIVLSWSYRLLIKPIPRNGRGLLLLRPLAVLGRILHTPFSQNILPSFEIPLSNFGLLVPPFLFSTCFSSMSCSWVGLMTPFQVSNTWFLWTRIKAGRARGITPFKIRSILRSLLLLFFPFVSSTSNFPTTTESSHSLAHPSNVGSTNLHGPHLYKNSLIDETHMSKTCFELPMMAVVFSDSSTNIRKLTRFHCAFSFLPLSKGI